MTFMILADGTGCCKQYLAVEFSAGRARTAAPAEVSATPTYASRLPAIRSVSIRLPESCLQTNASAARGTGAGGGNILLSQCGVWLAELERVLSQSGYRVFSWQALYTLQTTQSLPLHVAAQQLGVDAVFVVNSLDTSVSTQSDTAEASRLVFYASNPAGDRLSEQALNTPQRNVLRCLVWQRAGYRVDDSRSWHARVGDGCVNTTTDIGDRVESLAVTLNVNVLFAASGESIWFYNRTLTAGTTNEQNRRFLFRGRDVYWRPVLPTGAEVQLPTVDVDRAASSETVSATSTAGPQDQRRASEFGLIRTVVSDCVTRFRTPGGQRTS